MLTIDKIKKDIHPIAKKYDVKKIGLFGSYADGTQRLFVLQPKIPD